MPDAQSDAEHRISIHEPVKHHSTPVKTMKDAAASASRKTASTTLSIYHDFTEFIKRGKVVDLAVGIIIGGSFTKIVNSLVSDLIAPIIGLAISGQLEHKYLPINDPNGKIEKCKSKPEGTPGCSFFTPEDAHEAGIVTWNYGRFLQATLNFLIIAFIIFVLVKLYSAAFNRHEKKEPSTKECDYCNENIPILAKRCKFCTSHLDIKES